MVIVGKLRLKEPGTDNPGVIEIMVAHNNKPGAPYEAEQAFRKVRDVFVHTDVEVEWGGEGWSNP